MVSLSSVRPRSTKSLLIAVTGSIALAAPLLVAGCGEKSEPPTSGPVVTQTTGSTATTTDATTGSTAATDDKEIEATVVSFLTVPNDPKVCHDLITPAFLKRSYGNTAGCVASRKPSAMAKDVAVKPAYPAGVVAARPKGGVFDGQTLKVTTINIDGKWTIDKITSNTPVGP
jgi:hypothetical protein